MSFVEKLWFPKKIVIGGWILIATLAIAIGLQVFAHMETFRLVKTVIYYLVLDYAWATVKREWSNGAS